MLESFGTPKPKMSPENIEEQLVAKETHDPIELKEGMIKHNMTVLREAVRMGDPKTMELLEKSVADCIAEMGKIENSIDAIRELMESGEVSAGAKALLDVDTTRLQQLLRIEETYVNEYRSILSEQLTQAGATQG